MAKRRLPSCPSGLAKGILAAAVVAACAAGALPSPPGTHGACWAAEQRVFTLTGGRVLQPDGTLADGLAVVVAGDRIRRVAGDAESDLPGPVKLAPGTVIAPGLIDLCSSIAAHRQNVEVALPVDPGASARAAIDPYHRDLHLALEAGITCAMVCPAPGNVVAGSAVTFRTETAAGRPDVLRDDGPLVFALGRSVLRSDREPTALGGARHLLLDALDAARGGRGHPRLESFVKGRTAGLVFCDAGPSVRSALEVFADLGRQPAFVYQSDTPLDDTRRFAREVARRKAAVVVGPLDFDSPERVLREGGLLESAGVKVAFRGGLPVSSRDSLRVTAALAVRHGMTPPAARRALTRVAAEVAGVADRVGAIAPGKAADLVIFSGDPLRLDARVLEVYVRGVRVYVHKVAAGK
jgi:imidazolonepropionase-like amidohydrolase